MAKIRVYELANELKIQSKDVIKFLEEKNITGKTASSSIEDDTITMVKNKFSGNKPQAAKGESQEKSAGKEPVKAETVKNESAEE